MSRQRPTTDFHNPLCGIILSVDHIHGAEKAFRITAQSRLRDSNETGIFSAVVPLDLNSIPPACRDVFSGTLWQDAEVDKGEARAADHLPWFRSIKLAGPSRAAVGTTIYGTVSDAWNFVSGDKLQRALVIQSNTERPCVVVVDPTEIVYRGYKVYGKVTDIALAYTRSPQHRAGKSNGIPFQTMRLEIQTISP